MHRVRCVAVHITYSFLACNRSADPRGSADETWYELLRGRRRGEDFFPARSTTVAADAVPERSLSVVACVGWVEKLLLKKTKSLRAAFGRGEL